LISGRALLANNNCGFVCHHSSKVVRAKSGGA
jgi:hypothetical protein